MNIKRLLIGLIVVIVSVMAALYFLGCSIWIPIYSDMTRRRTVDDVLRDIGPRADLALKPAFEMAELQYPPGQVEILAFKEEKRLELWAKNLNRWVFVTGFPIRAASGTSGPKLREGDRQVPEGIYRIEALNPNSSYHLSMKLNYPNEFDQLHGKSDGRSNLGSDIFIHGKDVSIGCLAMGDDVAEQLFVLVSRVGSGNVEVVIAPRNCRRTGIVGEKNIAPN